MYSVPEPAPGRNTTKIVLWIVGGVLALCCVGGGVVAFTLVHDMRQAAGPARDALDTYLHDLERADFAGAYGRTCDDIRLRVTQEQFEAGLRDIRTIQGHRIGNISALNSNGQISVTITATLRLSGGESTTRVFSLIEERDVWKVCG